MQPTWETLEAAVRGCTRCALCNGRTQAVPGEGARNARVMFVGEGPGRDEDATGRPFVGAAGQLLDKMLAAIDLSREKNAFIANVVKCRPPGNRVPSDTEAVACLPFLRAQFALLRPKLVVCLGVTAARYVYDANVRITRDRGVFLCKKGVDIVATYHPAALLRDAAKKYDAWEDLKAIKARLDALG